MRFRLRQPDARIPRPRVRVLRWLARRSRPTTAVIAFDDGDVAEVDASLLVMDADRKPRATRKRWRKTP